MPSPFQQTLDEAAKTAADLADALAKLSASFPQQAPQAAPEPTRLVGLQNPQAFYDHIRGDAGELFPTMLQTQMDGVEALLAGGAGVLPVSWMAYCLATPYHETNRTMQPVKEAYWCSEDWRRQHLKYYPYYGRGLVQLTWHDNYQRAGELLGLDLVDNPDIALQMKYAVQIMLTGMTNGWFTGKKLRDFIPADPTRDNYKNARQIINGMDKADLIAGYAIEFEKGLRLGDWR